MGGGHYFILCTNTHIWFVGVSTGKLSPQVAVIVSAYGRGICVED